MTYSTTNSLLAAICIAITACAESTDDAPLRVKMRKPSTALQYVVDGPQWFRQWAPSAVLRDVLRRYGARVVGKGDDFLGIYAKETRLLAWQITEMRIPPLLLSNYAKRKAIKPPQFCEALVWFNGETENGEDVWALVRIEADTERGQLPDLNASWHGPEFMSSQHGYNECSLELFTTPPTNRDVLTFLTNERMHGTKAMLNTIGYRVLKSGIENDVWRRVVSDTIPQLW